MQPNSEIIKEEQLAFLLKGKSGNGKIIFVSENHEFLENLYYNLLFLECSTILLNPRFALFINHGGLDGYNFLKSYINVFEQQPNITLVHSSLVYFPLPEPDSYKKLKLSVGMKTSMTDLAKSFSDLGYSLVSTVYNPSEFAIRGYILDFATSEHNVRVEFMGNTIESIKLFDTQTQRSLEIIQETTVYPNKLISQHICDVDQFKVRYQMAFQEENSDLAFNIAHHPEACDINKYTKLLVKNTVNILDILDGNILLHNISAENILHFKDIKFLEQKHNIPHGAFYFSENEITQSIKDRKFETVAVL